MAKARAKPKDPDIKIPEDREDEEESWKNAYRHAFGKGCTEKAACLYADAHGHEEYFGGEGEE